MNSQAAHVRNVQRNMVCKAMLRLHLCGLPMVKHTHDEFQYIQLSINYESPALLPMHQLRRGKLRHTVQRVHEAEKRAYRAHEKCKCSMLYLYVDVWEEEKEHECTHIFLDQ